MYDGKITTPLEETEMEVLHHVWEPEEAIVKQIRKTTFWKTMR